jgi:transposase-like protein
MAGKAGMSYALSDEEMRGAVDALVSEGNISAAARKLGIHRASLINRLKRAEEAGISGPRRTQANPSRWRPGDEIVAARKAEFERLEASVRYDGNIIHRPDNGPFMLIALGDEHLDNPGTDLKLWERWIGFLDRAKHRHRLVHGRRAGQLGQAARAPLRDRPDDRARRLDLARALHGADRRAPGRVGRREPRLLEQRRRTCWAIMQRHGVLHRGNSARVRYRCPSGREITVHGRHSWPGRSMWSEVHALKRAARMGVRDTILLGGHTHVSGEGVEKDPVTGRYTFVYQVASFQADRRLRRHAGPSRSPHLARHRARDRPRGDRTTTPSWSSTSSRRSRRPTTSPSCDAGRDVRAVGWLTLLALAYADVRFTGPSVFLGALSATAVCWLRWRAPWRR